MVSFLYKIVVPKRPRHLISRPQLNELLSAITERQLIVISASAGYGKTSLLVDFATSAAPPDLPLCWYALDTSDQDVWIFFDYLVGAIEQRLPGAMSQTRRLLEQNTTTSFGVVLGMLTRELYGIGQEIILVIDDWHLVDYIPEIVEVVAHLLRCPNCHIMLASRSYPTLPNMMLLTARRQMDSFNEQHLRFTTPELAAALAAEYNIAIKPHQAHELAEQTGGWITGALLSFGLQERGGLSASAGGDRQVYRFLSEQVFQQQPPDLQRFMLETALLEELAPDRCDALFGRDNSRQLLARLLQRHLFVSETRAGALRYQPLFREFLLEQFALLHPAEYVASAMRVADAYASEGEWQLAFDHYLKVNAREAAQQVIVRGGERLYMSGRLETLERWFGTLHADELSAPLLCLKARVQLDRGCYDDAKTLANLAATRMQPDEAPMVLLVQAQIARISGRYQQALDLAQQVLGQHCNSLERASALRTVAICHHRLRQTNQAITELQEALAIQQRCGALDAVAHLQRDLGLCYTAIGLLNDAEEHYASADNYWAATGNGGLRAMSLNSIGGVQHMMGRFKAAHTTYTTALEHAREAGIPNYQAAVASNLGDLYTDLQLWERAETAYRDALALGGSAHLRGCLHLSLARLRLYQQQFNEARRELQQIPATLFGDNVYAVRLLDAAITAGLGNPCQAATQLGALIVELGQADYKVDLARAYLLQAYVVLQLTPDDNAALTAALGHMMAVAQQVGQDVFLVTAMFNCRGMLRRLTARQWPLAEAWRLRHQDMAHAAAALTQTDGRPLLSVCALGTDQILLDSQPIELGWNKAREIFYYLLQNPNGVKIETLREAIWPNLGAEGKQNPLSSAIYQLRSLLPRDLIVLHRRQVYQIDHDVARISYDVQQFLQLLDTEADDTERLLEAINLYQGAFLEYADSEWSHALRAYLERRYLDALAEAAGRLEGERTFSEALTLYERVLTVDMLNERAHAGVMRCQIAICNRHAAISQYQKLRGLLDEELGLEINRDSEVEHLYRELLASA